MVEGKTRWSKQCPIEVEGKVLVGSLKESATVLRQTKEEGEMLEDTQGLFHSFERQSSSELGDLFLPALTPVLKMLIRELWATDSFPRFLISLLLAAVPEKDFYYLQRLRNTLAKKRGQESKGTGASFAEIALYRNYQFPTPPLIKAMANDLIFISSLALWTDLFSGKVVIFSPLSIILDRDAKIVYDHSCLDGALEGILDRITDHNPEPSSRAFLLIRDLSY